MSVLSVFLLDKAKIHNNDPITFWILNSLYFEIYLEFEFCHLGFNRFILMASLDRAISLAIVRPSSGLTVAPWVLPRPVFRFCCRWFPS